MCLNCLVTLFTSVKIYIIVILTGQRIYNQRFCDLIRNTTPSFWEVDEQVNQSELKTFLETVENEITAKENSGTTSRQQKVRKRLKCKLNDSVFL